MQPDPYRLKNMSRLAGIKQRRADTLQQQANACRETVQKIQNILGNLQAKRAEHAKEWQVYSENSLKKLQEEPSFQGMNHRQIELDRRADQSATLSRQKTELEDAIATHTETLKRAQEDAKIASGLADRVKKMSDTMQTEDDEAMDAILEQESDDDIVLRYKPFEKRRS